MGIEADKEEIGSIVWVDRCKFAQDRANAGDHNTSDIGVLWAEDKIATLTADHTALVEAVRAVKKAEDRRVAALLKGIAGDIDRLKAMNDLNDAVAALAALIDGGD